MQNPPERPPRSRPGALPWIVLGLEALLFVAAILVFRRYWLMLPVPYRIAGIAALSLVGAIGLFRATRLALKRS